MQLSKPACHAELGPSRIEQRQVGVGAHFNSAADGVAHHVKESGVHHGLAKALKLELFECRKLIKQLREDVEVHERRRAIRWTILPKVNRAHPAAQVALAYRLNLEK